MVTNIYYMTITLNHKSQTIEALSTLRDLLTQLSISDKGIAIAQNNCVISRVCWDTTQIQENDTITIIQATQGG